MSGVLNSDTAAFTDCW